MKSDILNYILSIVEIISAQINFCIRNQIKQLWKGYFGLIISITEAVPARRLLGSHRSNSQHWEPFTLLAVLYRVMQNLEANAGLSPPRLYLTTSPNL